MCNAVLNSVSVVNLNDITQDVTLNFPEKVNRKRCQDSHYSVDERCKILRQCRAVSKLGLNLTIPSTNEKTIIEAVNKLTNQLTLLLEESKEMPFCAVYTSPPYTVLLCKSRDGPISIVDTLPIPFKYGGRINAGVISPTYEENGIRALCQWLLLRTCGKREEILQVLTPASSKEDLTFGISGNNNNKNNNLFISGLRPVNQRIKFCQKNI